MRHGAAVKVALATETQAEALVGHDAVRAEGYAAEIRPDDLQGKHVYHVRLSQLPSQAEAQALANSLRGRMGVAEPKVTM